MDEHRAKLEAYGLHEFPQFLKVVWRILDLPDPSPVQQDVASFISNTLDKRIVVEAFRGVGKSWITAAFVLWLLMLNPQLKIMVVSANQTRADDFSIFVKRLIETIPFLHFLKPKADQRYSNVAFDVGPAKPDQSPSVKSVGITGQLTGSRADIIIADDIEVPKNSYTHTQRLKILELVKEFEAVLKPEPGSRVIYLGTPQTQASIYNELGKRGYLIRIWPAQVPLDISVYKGRLAQFITQCGRPGSSVEPSRFTLDDLQERLTSYGPAGYQLQFMLSTALTDSERHPLKLKDLIVADLDNEMTHLKWIWSQDKEFELGDLPSVGLDGDLWHRAAYKSDEMTKYSGSVMFIDPSGEGKDETAYAVVKNLFGQLFLLDAGGFKDGYSEDTLKSLAAIAASNKVNDVRIEKNYGGGMFTALVTPAILKVHKCSIEEIWHTGQKERRIIDTLRPVMQAHKLIISRAVVEKDLIVNEDEDVDYSLFHQMTRITVDKGAIRHDDRLEAVAGAVAFWVESMARDTDKAADAHKASAAIAAIQKFMKNVTSQVLRSPKAPSGPLWRKLSGR